MSAIPVSPDAETARHELAAPRRRRLDRHTAKPVNATWFRPCSTRGLFHRLVIVRECPYCGDAHQFRDDGLRIASCGEGYIIIKARKARGTRVPA